MIDSGRDFLTSRDMWPIQRELGSAHARQDSIARDVHDLRADMGAMEGRMIAQLNGIRADLLTGQDKSMHGLRAQIADLDAREEEQRRRTDRLLLVIAVLAGAALGLEGLTKLGLL